MSLKETTSMCFRVFSRVKLKTVIWIVTVIFILYYFGVFTHLFEADYHSSFNYPLEGDIKVFVEQLKNQKKPDVPPINFYNYTFLSNCKEKCAEEDGFTKLRLVYIIKSAMYNFDKRLAIRHSWGFEKRFSDVPIRRVFLLGTSMYDVDLQKRIEEEQMKHGDIVQADFIDSYYNNTIKTMIGFKWAMEFCRDAKFYMFSDDDMYVSTKNVLRFVRNPTNYPGYLEDPVFSLKEKKRLRRRSLRTSEEIFTQGTHKAKDENDYEAATRLVVKYNSRKLNQVMDFELPDDVKLFSGYVFVSSPHRHKLSKWYTPLEEYKFHLWPPYVTAGAYILSKDALVDMYYGSFYTKHFRFDDIFLGLVAKKIGIEPYHCDQFYFYKKDYDVHSYQYVIASHGYDNPRELIEVWNEQRSVGNA